MEFNKVKNICFENVEINLSNGLILPNSVYSAIMETYEDGRGLIVNDGENNMHIVNPSLIPYIKVNVMPCSDSENEYLTSLTAKNSEVESEAETDEV